jgi:hypothetical protein
MKTEAVHAWFMERDHQENALYVFFSISVVLQRSGF